MEKNKNGPGAGFRAPAVERWVPSGLKNSSGGKRMRVRPKHARGTVTKPPEEGTKKGHFVDGFRSAGEQVAGGVNRVPEAR